MRTAEWDDWLRQAERKSSQILLVMYLLMQKTLHELTGETVPLPWVVLTGHHNLTEAESHQSEFVAKTVMS